MPEIVVKIPKLESRLEKQVVKGIESLAKAEVARVVLLERLNKMLSKSKLTEEDAIKLGRMVKKGRFEKLRKMGLV